MRLYPIRFLETRSRFFPEALIKRIADRDLAGSRLCQELGSHVDRVADGAHVRAAKGPLGHNLHVAQRHADVQPGSSLGAVDVTQI